MSTIGFLPSLRAIRTLNREPVAFMERLAAQRPENDAVVPFARIRGTTAVAVFDPKIASTILTHRDFGLAEVLMRVLGADFGRRGPFTTEGDEWAKINVLLRPAFHPDTTLSGVKADSTTREALRMVQQLCQAQKTGRPCNVIELAQQSTMRLACLVVLGISIGESSACALNEHELVQCQHDVEELVQATFELMNNPALIIAPHHYLRRRIRKHRLAATIQRIMAHEPNPHGPPTVHRLLKEARDAGHIDDITYASCLLQLLVAGHETTASALGWMLYELATKPDCSADTALRREATLLHELSGNERFDYACFPAIATMVSRALSRHAPIISVFRQCHADTALVDSDNRAVHLLKGTLIYLPLVYLNRRLEEENIGPNALQTLVFSRGRRTCPGARLATMFLMRCLANIIHEQLRFTVHSQKNPTEHLAYKPRLTLNVSTG